MERLLLEDCSKNLRREGEEAAAEAEEAAGVEKDDVDEEGSAWREGGAERRKGSRERNSLSATSANTNSFCETCTRAHTRTCQDDDHDDGDDDACQDDDDDEPTQDESGQPQAQALWITCGEAQRCFPRHSQS
eukprot:3077023-Rhodomonas_salina.6